jgi:hypothetical protein
LSKTRKRIMSKKQISQPAEVTQQGLILSTLPEQVESDNQLPLSADDTTTGHIELDGVDHGGPFETEEECALCEGTGVVDDGGVKIVCPACHPQQAIESQGTALAVAPASAGQQGGQICRPAPTGNSGATSGLCGHSSNAAEETCPNCQGRKFFTEKVMNDEGKPVDTTINCGRCNGLGYILIPLYSPVLAQEKVMASKWPTESFEINWPWVGEPDPMIGTVVGWNWQTKEVAVIAKQPQYLNMKPWKVTIELKPMPERLLSCLLIGIDEPVVHKRTIWYSAWTRTGERMDEDLVGPPLSFFGKCLVQELV